jgi:ATP-dependent DNA ligase
LPSFAQTQAATDGEQEVRLVYCAFDLLQLAWDVSKLPLIERKALLESLVANNPVFSSMVMRLARRQKP